MGYGAGIVLAAVGLIIAYAIDADIQGVDLTLIGLILAGAGVAIVLATVIQQSISNNSQNRQR